MCPGTKRTECSPSPPRGTVSLAGGAAWRILVLCTGRFDGRHQEEMQFLEKASRGVTPGNDRGREVTWFRFKFGVGDTRVWGWEREGCSPQGGFATFLCSHSLECAGIWKPGSVALCSAWRSNLPTLPKPQWELRWELAILCDTTLKRGRKRIRGAAQQHVSKIRCLECLQPAPGGGKGTSPKFSTSQVCTDPQARKL